MTHPPDIIKNQSGATRSVREPEGPLLEAFWGKGDEARALYREVQEIVARKYGPRPNLSPPKPARPARKPRTPPPDGLKTAAQAAAKLGCSIKTLNGHVASGALKYVALGHGKRRKRKMFADGDLNEFVANQTRKELPPCLSDATRGRRSTPTTSRSTVVAFSALRRRPPGEKLKS